MIDLCDAPSSSSVASPPIPASSAAAAAATGDGTASSGPSTVVRIVYRVQLWGGGTLEGGNAVVYTCTDSSARPPPSLQPDLKSRLVCTYPARGMSSGVQLSVSDLYRLTPGMWLNDALLEAFLRFTWRERLHRATERARVQVMSSYLYPKLAGRIKEASEQRKKDRARGTASIVAARTTEALIPQAKRRPSPSAAGASSSSSGAQFEDLSADTRRWSEVDPFEHDFVFIPINDASHWSIAVLCYPGLLLPRSAGAAAAYPLRQGGQRGDISRLHSMQSSETVGVELSPEGLASASFTDASTFSTSTSLAADAAAASGSALGLRMTAEVTQSVASASISHLASASLSTYSYPASQTLTVDAAVNSESLLSATEAQSRKRDREDDRIGSAPDGDESQSAVFSPFESVASTSSAQLEAGAKRAKTSEVNMGASASSAAGMDSGAITLTLPDFIGDTSAVAASTEPASIDVSGSDGVLPADTSSASGPSASSAKRKASRRGELAALLSTDLRFKDEARRPGGESSTSPAAAAGQRAKLAAPSEQSSAQSSGAGAASSSARKSGRSTAGKRQRSQSEGSGADEPVVIEEESRVLPLSELTRGLLALWTEVGSAVMAQLGSLPSRHVSLAAELGDGALNALLSHAGPAALHWSGSCGSAVTVPLLPSSVGVSPPPGLINSLVDAQLARGRESLSVRSGASSSSSAPQSLSASPEIEPAPAEPSDADVFDSTHESSASGTGGSSAAPSTASSSAAPSTAAGKREGYLSFVSAHGKPDATLMPREDGAALTGSAFESACVQAERDAAAAQAMADLRHEEHKACIAAARDRAVAAGVENDAVDGSSAANASPPVLHLSKAAAARDGAHQAALLRARRHARLLEAVYSDPAVAASLESARSAQVDACAAKARVVALCRVHHAARAKETGAARRFVERAARLAEDQAASVTDAVARAHASLLPLARDYFAYEASSNAAGGDALKSSPALAAAGVALSDLHGAYCALLSLAAHASTLQRLTAAVADRVASAAQAHGSIEYHARIDGKAALVEWQGAKWRLHCARADIAREVEQARSWDPAPCIIFLDSLRAHKLEPVARVLRRYLHDQFRARYLGPEELLEEAAHEAAAKAAKAAGGGGGGGRKSAGAGASAGRLSQPWLADTTVLFNAESMPAKQPEALPRQANTWDCGVFVLAYAGRFCNPLLPHVTPHHLASGLRHIFGDRWFQSDDIPRMRREMMGLWLRDVAAREHCRPL